MKKSIFALLAILMIASGVAYAVQSPDGNAHDTRGMGAPGYVPYREYQLVRYSESGPNGTSLTAGDVVIWDCVSDDGVSVGLVGVAGSSDAVAGVVVSTAIQTVELTGVDMTASLDYGRRNWGWIQVRGYNTSVNLVGGGVAAAGQSLKASDTARNADASVNTGTGVIRRVLGFAYDTGNNPEIGIGL